jgi:hypothetical protein
MTALTQGSRLTAMVGPGPVPNYYSGIVKTGVQVWAGAIVAVDALGFLVPANAANNPVRVLGRAEHDVLGDGTKKLDVRRGAFDYANSAAGDAITQAQLGQIVYVVDDNTVAATDLNGTRIPAGEVVGVGMDSGGNSTISPSGYPSAIQVQLGAGATVVSAASGAAGLKGFLSFQVPLAAIAGVGDIFKRKMNQAGRIKALSVHTTTISTTAAKSVTLQPTINPIATPGEVTVTGGIAVLTTVSNNTLGNELDATAITGANTFVSGDTIAVKATVVTAAFVEGAVEVVIELG